LFVTELFPPPPPRNNKRVPLLGFFPRHSFFQEKIDFFSLQISSLRFFVFKNPFRGEFFFPEVFCFPPCASSVFFLLFFPSYGQVRPAFTTQFAKALVLVPLFSCPCCRYFPLLGLKRVVAPPTWRFPETPRRRPFF